MVNIQVYGIIVTVLGVVCVPILFKIEVHYFKDTFMKALLVFCVLYAFCDGLGKALGYQAWRDPHKELIGAVSLPEKGGRK